MKKENSNSNVCLFSDSLRFLWHRKLELNKNSENAERISLSKLIII